MNVHYRDFASSLREFESAAGSMNGWKWTAAAPAALPAVIDQRADHGLFVPEPGKELQPLSVLCVSLTPAAREQAMPVLATWN